MNRGIFIQSKYQFPGGVRSDRHTGMTVLGKIQRCIKFSVEKYIHVKVENMFVDEDELQMKFQIKFAQKKSRNIIGPAYTENSVVSHRQVQPLKIPHTHMRNVDRKIPNNFMRQKADGMRPDLVNDVFLSVIIIHFITNHNEAIGNQLRNVIFQESPKTI